MLTCKVMRVQGLHSLVTLDDLCLVVNEETEANIEPEEFMGFEVLVDSTTGELCNFSVSDGTHSFMRSLDRDFTGHGTGKAQILVGHCKAIVQLAVYTFGVPRNCKMRCFWSLHDLYLVLGLTSYQEQASKWVYQTRHKWRQFFAHTVGVCQLVGGTSAGHIGQSHSTAVFFSHFRERCLATSAVSTVGFIMLLNRIVYCQQQQGGLQEGQAAARELWTAVFHIVTAALRNSLSVLLVYFVDRFPIWPRPAPTEAKLVLPVTAEGLVDLRSLKPIAHGEPSPPRSLARRWEKAMSGGQNWSWQLPLWDLLKLCTTKATIVVKY